MKRSTIEHGGPCLAELRRLGIDPAGLLDFSVCINPFGPAPGVYDAVARAALDQYPDRDAHALRQVLADRHAVTCESILPGNGASELIALAAQAFIRSGDRVLVVGPTYGEYARAATLQRATIRACDAHMENRFEPPTRNIESELERFEPRLIFLCNPNNPTGSALDPEAILTWVRRHRDTLFVVDEAYQAFASGLRSLASAQEPNLLILRSLTKDHSLAGLRIGYAVGMPEIIDELRRFQSPWSVNSLAQAAAVAALADERHLTQTLADLGRATVTLTAGLTDLGLDVWRSATHFFLVRVEDGSSWRLKLLKRDILVRDAASFGLPAFVRISTRTPADNARLLSVLCEEAARCVSC
jgi:L-threonine-O-3-phosphate decarboxylase